MPDMRPLLIFGASRGVGLELARLERATGRPVAAMLRPQSDAGHLQQIGVEILRGDALSRPDIEQALAQLSGPFDTVSTLSGRGEDGRLADDEGNINVIETVAASGSAGRFVLITSMGCGDMAPYRSERAIAAFGAVVDAKTLAEDRLRKTGLDWTILRPGGLLSEPATGNGLLTQNPQVHGFIHRADVALLASRVLRDPATSRHAFAAVDRNRMSCDTPVEPFSLA
ncbi:SDR family oxidoreductase [Rhizobium wenxiniae]|uniref:SDR family oxidoreductase n=1 Tax=Rhizobium wenxiniae TaxID=1737357 RepID=UPI001CB76CFF|nr:SDR family oxidoreductase [Rhizobium wenxiniae]